MRVDHPPYYACRYYNRLSTLPTIHSTLLGDILQPAICCALLCLATLHPTIPVDITADYSPYFTLSRDTTSDYLLCSTLYGDITSDYPIYRLSALICMAILQPTIWCTLLGAILCLVMLQATIQSTDCPLCSV
jgi:hypothetical protein